MIRAGVGFSDKFSPSSAAAEAVAEALRDLGSNSRPSAALVFATAAWGPELATLIGSVGDRLEGCPMVGSSVAGLFSAGRGTAENPGLCIALLEGLELESVAFDDLMTDDPESGSEILDHLATGPDAASPLLLLADVARRSPGPLLARLEARAPEAIVMGLGASPLPRGVAVVWRDAELMQGGIVAAVLRGASQARVDVSFGCRVASPPLCVTRSRDRWISTFDGKPALGLLEEVARAAHLPASAESLRQMLIAVVPTTGPGRPVSTSNLLCDGTAVYNVAGIDPRRNAILLPEQVDPGATIQIAVRDAVSARESLEALVDTQVRPTTAFCLHLSGASLDRVGADGASRDARCFEERASGVPVLGLQGAQLLGPSSGVGSQLDVLTDRSLLASFEV
jgi:small ligand-binding sensory domain FIST